MNLVRSNYRGFTLLELLIVLFIIGTLAAASLSFIEQDGGQQRYTASIQRLNLIADGLVKVKNHGHNQQLIAGFVFDNGTLPPIPSSGSDGIQPLIAFHDSWSNHASNSYSASWSNFDNYIPKYIKTDGVVIPLTAHTQFKGYRGPYLPTSTLDSDRQFRDLWNMPYILEAPSNLSFRYTLENVLADATTKKLESFNASVTQETNIAQWSVALGQLAFTVINDSGVIINAGKKVSLIVFDNSAALPWHTYHFQLGELAIDETQIHGFGATLAPTWHHNAYAIASNAMTSNQLTSIEVNTTRIPVGSHLFIVMDEDAGVGIYPVIANTQVLLMPSSSVPNISLKIG